MSGEENYDILIATHLVPYFALDDQGRNPSLEDNLDRLDYSQFSETALVDTSGRTGISLPENHSYNTEFEDIEKGALEPEDADSLVEKGDTFYLVGGKPEICMSNSYRSLVEAARTYDEDIDFRILTPCCFNGPGEGSLEDELTKDKPDEELLTGLLSSYDFENTIMVSEDSAIENIENHLRQTQRMYRAQEILDRRNYNVQFETEADRFQNYGSSQIHFNLDGGELPSGAINGVEHYPGITNIFEELDEFKIDYSLKIEGENGKLIMELQSQGEEFELEEIQPDSELTEVRQLLSEKAKLPVNNRA